MSSVGIIANPASGKDLRRIISSGITVTNAVKENAVQRMLLAMDALGVERALIMPDRSNLARRVLLEVEGELGQLQVQPLDMPYVLGTQDDSIRAAALMVEEGVDVLIVLGGDGTSRVVSKRCGEVPILPVSTGTNNVFPEMIEGTLAGMAAAALATGVVSPDEVCRRAPRLDLVDEQGCCVDHALQSSTPWTWRHGRSGSRCGSGNSTSPRPASTASACPPSGPRWSHWRRSAAGPVSSCWAGGSAASPRRLHRA